MKIHLGLLLLLVTGCSSMRVQTAHDPQTSFAGLRTFCWVAPPQYLFNDARLHMDRLDPQMRDLLPAQLNAKGFHQTDCDRADLQVTYRVGVQDRIVAQQGMGANLGPSVAVYTYSADSGGQWFTTPPDVDLLDERVGSLVIEIRKPKSTDVIWKATVTAELLKNASAADRYQRLQQAVQLAFKDFPPKK
jgi:hypothetical protein